MDQPDSPNLDKETAKAASVLFMAFEKRFIENLEDTLEYDSETHAQKEQLLLLANKIWLYRRVPTELRDDQLIDSWMWIPIDTTHRWYVGHTRDGEYYGMPVADEHRGLSPEVMNTSELNVEIEQLLEQQESNCEFEIAQGLAPKLHPKLLESIRDAIKDTPPIGVETLSRADSND